MIRNSLFVAAFLFITYEIILRVTDISWDTSQNDKSANIISTQDFLFNYNSEEMSGDTVVVGTSVSRKLITDSIGKNYINLAFNAWNTFDGLELIKLSGKKPACILIETNYAKNQHLEPEITDNLEPITYYSEKIFKSLQLKNQPVGLLIGWGKNLMRNRIEEMKKLKRSNISLYQSNLLMNKDIMNISIPDSVLNKRFIVLKSLIEGFRAEHINVIFFEVPINEVLQQTASMQEVRSFYNSYFPKKEFLYVPLPPENNFIFSDGVHLAPESALAYSLYLKNELNNFSHP